jgi:arylsulfatase A-like enzyme
MRFTRAHTVNAICSPSRASLFTGVLPSTHGMVDCAHAVPAYRAKLDTSLEMWSQRLQAEGYNLGYFGKWHVERSNRLEHFGFDEYIVHGPGEHASGYPQYRRSLGLPPQPESFIIRQEVRHPGYRPYLTCGVIDEPVEGTREYCIYSQGIDYLRRAASQGRPWCTFISTSGPGDPHHVPASYYERYDPAQIQKPANFDDDLADKPNIYRRMRAIWRDMEWPDYARAIARYYGSCSLIDDQIARVLQALEDTGQADRTIVIYANDHGTMMGAHGLMCLGVFPFEEGYRIPLIVRWPEAGLAGTTCDRLVSLLDLGPTIMEMTGCGELSRAQGKSLVRLLRGREPAEWRDDAYAEFHGQTFFWTQRIVWTDQFKYVFNGFDFDELYDLRTDPHELTNLAGDPQYAHVCREMAGRMWAWVQAAGDDTMRDSHYGMFLFAPVGPGA